MRKSQLQILAIPIFSFLAILIIGIIAAQTLWGRINAVQVEINAIKSEQTIVTQKLNNLEQIDDAALSLTEAAYLALPDTNPGTLVLSHLRSLAEKNTLVLSQINITETKVDGEETAKVIIDLKSEGNFNNMVAFLDSLQRLAPIINIENVKVTKSGSEYEMASTVNSFWASLPTLLPDTTQGVDLSLSEAEINILTELNRLEKPNFTELPPASSAAQRDDPFTFEE